jgi:D-alanine-D-alanine ligase
MVQKRKVKVALLFGGRSAEHEVSIISAGSIFQNLNTDKYTPSCIYINKKGLWRATESPFLAQAELEKGPFSTFIPWGNQSASPPLDADIYFPVLHGPHGEDGTIQGVFEMADVPYVGATVLASAIGMDKAIAKNLFQQKKLPVVRHFVLLEHFWDKEPDKILENIHRDYALPFFVKPANMGSSVGIRKITDKRQTRSAIRDAFRYDAKILIEQGIQGREIECSVLGNAHPEASLPGEIIPHRDFYDYKDKYIEGKTSFKIPAELPPHTVEKFQKMAVAAFQAIGCCGMARVDFFLQEKTQKLFVNEINTIPGFTKISMYPKLWEVSGLPYAQLLDRLIALGLERHKNKKREGAIFEP